MATAPGIETQTRNVAPVHEGDISSWLKVVRQDSEDKRDRQHHHGQQQQQSRLQQQPQQQPLPQQQQKQQQNQQKQQMPKRNDTDLNDQVNTLLDSFDSDRQDFGGGLLPLPTHRSSTDEGLILTKTTAADDFSPQMRFGHPSPRPPASISTVSSASLAQSRGLHPGRHHQNHHPNSNLNTRFSKPPNPSSFGPRW